ncbi:hypothetical protein ACFL0Q_04580 [Thermodesulfobacteriota bacterium]
MLYVERDSDGRIIALHGKPGPDITEGKSSVDQELIDFVSKKVNEDSLKLLLSLSDIDTIRVLEDLIDLLVRKNVIILTELPEQAQARIRERKRIREQMVSQSLTVDDIL